MNEKLDIKNCITREQFEIIAMTIYDMIEYYQKNRKEINEGAIKDFLGLGIDNAGVELV